MEGCALGTIVRQAAHPLPVGDCPVVWPFYNHYQQATRICIIPFKMFSSPR
jgi:hypothetical protein